MTTPEKKQEETINALDVHLSPTAQARLDEGLASARRGEISPWKRSDLKLPPGACHDCGGEGQVVQQYGPDDNYDGANCSTCDSSGLAPSPIRGHGPRVPALRLST